MIPTENPEMVQHFKSKLMEHATLDTAAKLMSQKASMLNNVS